MLDFEDESENANYGIIVKLIAVVVVLIGMVILGMSLFFRKKKPLAPLSETAPIEESQQLPNITIVMTEAEPPIGFVINEESATLRQRFQDEIDIDSDVLHNLLDEYFNKPFKALSNDEIIELVQIIHQNKKIYDSLDIDSQFAILNWQNLKTDDNE